MAERTVKHIGVVGTGSWATALIKVLTENGHRVNWFFRKPDIAEQIKKTRHNPNYLSSAVLQTKRIQFFSDIDAFVCQSDILLFAIPSAFFLKVFKTKACLKDKILISAVKGILPAYHQTVSEYFIETLQIPKENVIIISGPSHAEEVALKKKTYLTFSSGSESTAKIIRHLFSTDYIFSHYSDDVKGVEYAAVLKNVFAIGIGIAHGLGYGDNFIAILLSRAAKEMYAFLHALHLNDRDFLSASYLGDLVVTAYSEYSRNRRLGYYVGQYGNINDALKKMKMVAEGYYNAKSIFLKNKELQVTLNFAETIYNILYQGKDPKSAFRQMEPKLN